LHLEASISIEDLDLFKKAKQSASAWKGDMEKRLYFYIG
jgi:hypothetical protein